MNDRLAYPAYAVLLLTGLAMRYRAQIPWSAPWLRTGLILYVLLLVIAAADYTPTLRRQIDALHAAGPDSPEYRELAGAQHAVGHRARVIVVLIVFMMVAKPPLWG